MLDLGRIDLIADLECGGNVVRVVVPRAGVENLEAVDRENVAAFLGIGGSGLRRRLRRLGVRRVGAGQAHTAAVRIEARSLKMFANIGLFLFRQGFLKSQCSPPRCVMARFLVEEAGSFDRLLISLAPSFWGEFRVVTGKSKKNGRLRF